jgi:RimJ/RimL family protein N-acetyltransferase
MGWPEPVTLEGEHARLVPLTAGHVDAIAKVIADGELWRLWYTHVPPPEQAGELIAKRLELQRLGQWVPFAIEDRATGRVVGATNYMNIDAANRRLEIGGTFHAASVQRSAVNTECKLMLLTHAFETLDCIAVEFRTHRLNQQSRRAIERLGAQLDGILRSHQRAADGSLRDTAVYSIIAAEWPTIRTHLQWLLAKPRVAPGLQGT